MLQYGVSSSINIINHCRDFKVFVVHQRDVILKGAGHIDGLVQERGNSSALAMELRLSCTNPLICE